MIRKTIFLLAFWSFLPSGIFCQEGAFRQYTTREGLVQMQVQKVFQDSRGFLWIGTKAGISRFDGEKFENIIEGLPHPYIVDLNEDSKGNIWFPTAKGMVKYDGDSLFHYPATFKPYPVIAIDNNDHIWIKQSKQSIVKFDGQSYHALDKLHPDSVDSRAVRDLLYDKNTETMLITYNGKSCFAVEGDTLKKLIDKNFQYSEFINTRREKIYLQGKTFDGTEEIYEWMNGQFVRVVEKQDAELIFSDVNEDFFFLNKNALYKVDALTNTSSIITTFDFALARLQYIDAEGNFWLSSEEGLIQFFGEGFKIYTSLAFRYLWSMIKDDKGNYWLSSFQKGLFHYDGKEAKEVKGYLPLVKNSKSFYFGARKDNKGNLWFPHGDGIIKYNGQNYSHIKSYGANGKQNSNLFLFHDKEQSQFIAGVYKGVNFISEEGEIHHVGEKEGMHKTSYIVGIGKDKNRHYWFGSFAGLSRYDSEVDTFFNYTKEIGNLPSSGVISTFRDYKGNMWFGSRDGILYYDYTTDSIRQIGGEELHGDVNFIIDIDTTHLLIGALDGLYTLDLRAYYHSGIIKLKYFNHKNGFFGIEPAQNGVYKDLDGNIWIMSATITTKLIPDKLNLNIVPLKTYIATINGQKIDLSKDTIKYQVPYGENLVKINFEAIGFSRPTETSYSYLLEGIDKSWSDWQKENYIYFPGLSSNTYTFKVKSKTIGVNKEDIKAATIIFTIDLPLWKEPYFNQLVVIFAIIFIGTTLFFIWRNWNDRKKARENEQKVKYLQAQTLQTQMNPHFIFNVMGTLQDLILNSNTEQANEHLVDFSTMIRRFLDSSIRSDNPKWISFENEIPLEQELELLKMYIEFEQLQYKDTFDYELTISDELNPTNTRIPPMIIQPFVENAIKHGLRYKDERGFLSVRFSEQEESIICVVEDNGVGRKKAKEIQRESIKMYKSHGTTIVKRRVDVLNDMGYDINIGSADREHGGTIITIKISYK